jgi:hypothetical protein
MPYRIPAPTPERTRELDGLFRAARPVEDGPDFAMDAIRAALLLAGSGKIQPGDAVYQSLRHRIEAEIPHRTNALREALTASPLRPSEPDDAYALFYAGFRLVDDVLMEPEYEPTMRDHSIILRDLLQMAMLTRIDGMRITVVDSEGPTRAP